MKKIDVFKSLPNTHYYKLTKVLSKDSRNSMVYTNANVYGPMRIVEPKNTKDFCILVENIEYTGDCSYIRTSAVKKILATTSKAIIYETMGGYYLLEQGELINGTTQKEKSQ